MRVTIAHHRTKAEMVEKVDRSLNEMLGGSGGLPVKLTMDQRTWNGSVLTFAATAKMGFMSTPIKGTVEVTDEDLIIDADLGMLNNFVSDKAAQEMLGERVKGFLN
jgi:hypothetical protein